MLRSAQYGPRGTSPRGIQGGLGEHPVAGLWPIAALIPDAQEYLADRLYAIRATTRTDPARTSREMDLTKLPKHQAQQGP